MKISNIEELKAQQLRLKIRQLALQEYIREDWYELKDGLTPKNITRQVFSSVFTKPQPGEGNAILKYIGSFAAAGLAGKLLNKLKNKVVRIFS